MLIHAHTYELWYWHGRSDIFEQVRLGDGLEFDFRNFTFKLFLGSVSTKEGGGRSCKISK